MSNHVYGVQISDGSHVDVSRTLHGAKCYATRHGHKRVTVRLNCGYDAPVVAVRVGSRWVDGQGETK